MSTIEVLLATYNGEKYLEPLLNSLQGQTFRDFRVIARDDGSSDATIEILKRYPWVHLHTDQLGGLGAGGNFGALMSQATARYVAFCDQDDVWLPEKLELLYRKIVQLEAMHGCEKPLLVHSDLCVVDANLNVIADSFWEHQQLDPMRDHLQNLLLENVATGCATMINRALNTLALPIPSEATMHDSWLSLVASAFGEIAPIPQRPILYRQHGTNTLGARTINAAFVVGKVLQRLIPRTEPATQGLRLTQRQAHCFTHRYAERLTSEQYDLVKAYADFPYLSFFEKRRRLIKYGLGRNGWLRQLGLWIYV